MKVILYRLGDSIYATSALHVKSIERLLPIRYVPGAQENVLGVANLRGTIIGILDMRKQLCSDICALTSEARLLIAHGNGYVVDEALDIVESDETQWEDVGYQRVWQWNEQLVAWGELPV